MEKGVPNSPPLSKGLALTGFLFPHELVFSIKPLLPSQLCKRRKNTCPPSLWPCSGCSTQGWPASPGWHRLKIPLKSQRKLSRNQTPWKAKEEAPPAESIKAKGQNLQQRPPVHPSQTCSPSPPARCLFLIHAPRPQGPGSVQVFTELSHDDKFLSV